MRRAIKHVSKQSNNSDAVRHVVSRAKSMGHLDMIPSSWNEQSHVKQHGDVSLEQQFQEQSLKSGISVARLKCVYFRGIEEFQNSEIDIGSASMWALVRVQRYVNAVKSGNLSATDDHDLIEVNTLQVDIPDAGITWSIDSQDVFDDVIYNNCRRIADMFHPGTVTALRVTDLSLSVGGILGEDNWSYALDLVTGEHSFKFMT